MADTPTVLVVGGGVTGTGIARDLAMRGLEVVLAERGRLAAGATGNTHGLLHSGARYAVSDPASARECIRESRVLRGIAPHCVTETGGLFVALPEDDPDYVERKRRACEDCSIPTTTLSGEEARAREPRLADDAERAIAVPDGTVDPFRLCVATAVAAADRGVRVEPHAEVTDLLVEGTGDDRAVVGAELRHRDGPAKDRGEGTPGERERVRADHVVNAAGAWAGHLAAAAGVDVSMRPARGAMTVLDLPGIGTVLNRCRPKTSGDIVVPYGGTAVLGTTDVEVDDPDDYPREEWETDLLVGELADVVPAVADAPVCHSYWGVRPLYDPPSTSASASPRSEGGPDADPTDVTRTHYVLDHADRDGVGGFTTVVGGKLTTHRLMAEDAADRVCARLGVDADAPTASVPLPGHDDPEAIEAALAAHGLASTAADRGIRPPAPE